MKAFIYEKNARSKCVQIIDHVAMAVTLEGDHGKELLLTLDSGIQEKIDIHDFKVTLYQN